MKPGPNFKMSKANKTTIGHIKDKHLRGAIKRSLIEAQLISESKVKSGKDKSKES